MKRKFLIFIIFIIILVIGILIFKNISKEKIEDNDNDNNIIQDYIPNYEEVNRDLEKVTIKILENTITRKSLKISITDNNEYKYGWTNAFRIQKKVDGNWSELEKINTDRIFYSAVNNFDENNEMQLELNCEKYYGTLENGTYRIVKLAYSIGYFLEEFYSEEFIIQ